MESGRLATLVFGFDRRKGLNFSFCDLRSRSGLVGRGRSFRFWCETNTVDARRFLIASLGVTQSFSPILQFLGRYSYIHYYTVMLYIQQRKTFKTKKEFCTIGSYMLLSAENKKFNCKNGNVEVMKSNKRVCKFSKKSPEWSKNGAEWSLSGYQRRRFALIRAW